MKISQELADALSHEGQKDAWIEELLSYLQYDPATKSHPDWVADVQTLAAERDTLRAEVAALKAQIDQQHEDLDHFLSGAADDLPKIAALRKDAERYRWLRTRCNVDYMGVSLPGGNSPFRPEKTDAAIDTALADKPLSGPTP